ncbi:hypothetical protein Pcinc_026119 [Petrolisthes cinctipes]|uniref:Uncharacterized protein n=1 Tax=Petrolisthes cinctipes TaxID=88211 RepID=A0AAE1KCT6_PETCI|nr:hypothetical protein Pcinc_026119 [Petrolisthes cinctipes]
MSLWRGFYHTTLDLVIKQGSTCWNVWCCVKKPKTVPRGWLLAHTVLALYSKHLFGSGHYSILCITDALSQGDRHRSRSVSSEATEEGTGGISSQHKMNTVA